MNDSTLNDDAIENQNYTETFAMEGQIKLEKLKQLANKASKTYPPCFRNEPQEENILDLKCTSNLQKRLAEKALMKGRTVMKSRSCAPTDSGTTGAIPQGYPTMHEIELELGGVDGFFTLFACHYVGMFSNPRMKVLFDTRKEEDAKSSAMDHGKRIASTLLDLWYGTNHFSSLGRGLNGTLVVSETHKQAKNCPMRPLSQQLQLPKDGGLRASRRFTVKQRDSWVGHVCLAAEECGTSKEFQSKFGWWLATAVSAYAPFYNEETGELDWMEESPYINK